MTDDILYQTTRPNDNNAFDEHNKEAMMIPIELRKENVYGAGSNQAESIKDQEDNRDMEISSSATIRWCCSIALHLLQLSLNVDSETRKNQDFSKDLEKLKSDD